MEFTLDKPLIRRILEEEQAQSGGQIEAIGPLLALEHSQQRHDARIAAAPDVRTLACRSGCTWCCYFPVDVRAVEVFKIVEFMDKAFLPDQITRVQSEVRANSNTLKNLDEAERARRNVKCPFLQEAQCAIYAVRPQTCRNYHATNVAGCQQSYEEPDNADIDPEFAPGVYQAGGAHVEAFNNALSSAGYDVKVYEFNSALDAAFNTVSAQERFAAGLPPFSQLDGEWVAAEFDDLAD